MRITADTQRNNPIHSLNRQATEYQLHTFTPAHISHLYITLSAGIGIEEERDEHSFKAHPSIEA